MKQWIAGFGAGLGVLVVFGACDEGAGSVASRRVATLSEAADECFNAYENCLAEGGDQVVCKEAFVACTEQADANQPDPSTDDWGSPGSEPDAAYAECKLAYYACIDRGAPADECAQKLDYCAAAIAPEVAVPSDLCEEKHHACLEAGYDIWTCDDELESCLEVNAPDAPFDVCEDKLKSCFASGSDPAGCEDEYKLCVGAEPPPAPSDDCAGGVCQAGLDGCLAHAFESREKQACYEGFAACRLSLSTP